MAANEEGAPVRRVLVAELSPWLRNARGASDVADIHVPQLDAPGGALVQRLADRLLTWLQRAQQRRHLRTLNDNMLKDIGLSRADVDHETRRRFWQD